MDKIFEKNSIDQICDDIIKILKKSKEYMEDILSIANETDSALSEVPGYAKAPSVTTAVSMLRSHINGIDLNPIISSLDQSKNNVAENIVPADKQYAKETEALADNINHIREAFSQIRDFLVDTHLSCDYDEFMANLEVAKAKCEEIIEDSQTAVSRLVMHVKGEETKSIFYSKDPVNLSTGNFIDSHVDLAVKGVEPFTFRRFYNSVNHRDGILGKDWNHNHEIILEQDQRNKVLILEDGREERFLLASTGEYVSVYQSTGTLKQIEEGFIYSTREQRKYYFDTEGCCIRQETLNGACIRYIYENSQNKKRLKKIVRLSGEFFELLYDEQGYLSCVCDHTGRKIHYEITGGLLTAVSTPNGAWHRYGYTAQGKLEGTQNPEETVTVKNTYDQDMRTTLQEFPDGGTMSYIYDDKNRTVELTERNGSKTVYVHDDKFRDVKHIFSDGEERFEYNKLNQKTLFVDKLGNKTQYGYDSYGNRIKVINPLGSQMSLRYGDFNQLVSVTIDGVPKVVNRYGGKGNLLESEDAEGNAFKFHYQKQGQVDQILQPDGGAVFLERDARGNITCLTDPNGTRHLFVYDDLNQIVETIDGNGNCTSYKYDNNGNIIQVTDSCGNVRTYTYNRNNQVTCMLDFDGSITTREYNALNLPCKVVDKMGRATLLTYDSMWNVARVTQSSGSRTTFIYNEHNHLTRIRNANGDVVRFTYDAVGHRISKSDELGNISKFFYDAAGHLIKVKAPEGGCTEYKYDAEGHVTGVKDALGNEVHLQYDRNGRLIRETNPLGECRIYTYDCMGQLSSIANETGQVTGYEYDKCGHLVRIVYPEGKSAVYTHDGNGNVRTFTNPKGHVLTYTYDALDHVTRIEGSSGELKAYEYDCMGNVRSMMDGRGAVTCYEYSLTGKLLKVTDPLGNETSYTYDDRDRLVCVCQYEGKVDEDLLKVQGMNRTNCHITHYEHDLMGKLTKVTDGLGHTETYEYDKAGQLIAKVDKEGYLTKYGYTQSGAIETIQYADGREVKMSYNPIRQLTQIEDWLGITKIRSDAMGHVTGVTYPDGKEAAYTYGPRGERTGITYPDGMSIQYKYNEFTRLQKMVQGTQSILYEYDDTGYLSKKVFPNGIQSDYRYDEKGQLAALIHSDASGVLDEYSYQYDPFGNRTSVQKVRREMEAENGRYEYRYDLLGRLTDITKDGQQQRAYVYDAFGNRSSMMENGIKTDYSYNILDQLILKADSSLETSYEYDRRGNLSKVSENGSMISHYLYGMTNRLEEAVNRNGENAGYRYNGLGQRIGKTVGKIMGQSTALGHNLQEDMPELCAFKEIEYRLDMTRQYHNLLQKTEDGKKQTYLWDGNMAALVDDSDSVPQYYLKDELGSPIRLLYYDGGIHESYSYDEFGRNMNTGQDRNWQAQPFGFTGYQYDEMAETYFAQAREYRPAIGRFTARDLSPGYKSAPFTMNMYAYCYNHPIRLVDRNGMWAILDDIGDTLSDWGDSVTNTLDDWGDAVDRFIADPHKVISETVDNVAEAISGLVGDVGTAITDWGRKNEAGRAEVFEKLKQLGRPLCNSLPVQIMTVATQQGWVDDILEDFDFRRDGAGIFHTTPDCWQQYMGYCDLYDWVFDAGTSMKTNKYTIDMKSGDDYCIWMWKGDYLNLGAGTETGIYKGGEPFWDVSVQDALPMKVALYDQNGNVIMFYAPNDPQWWITGFDSMTQNVNEDDLEVIGSIDMKLNPKLWETFCEQYNNSDFPEFCFDMDNMTVYYNW